MICPQDAITVDSTVATIRVLSTLIPAAVATCMFMPTVLMSCPSFVFVMNTTRRQTTAITMAVSMGICTMKNAFCTDFTVFIRI